MKKLDSSLLNMTLVLTVVALVSAGLLAWVNEVTKGPISEQAAKTITDGIRSVMGSDDIEVAEADTVRQLSDGETRVFVMHGVSAKGGKPLGCAVESSVMGFGGEMRLLVGYDVEGHVLGYKVLQSSETPGLGQKADTWFQKDGKGSIIGRKLSVNKPLAVTKDNGEIDAITSSTITSRAFLKAVNQAYAAYHSTLKDIAPAKCDGVSSATKKTVSCEQKPQTADEQKSKVVRPAAKKSDAKVSAVAEKHTAKGHADADASEDSPQHEEETDVHTGASKVRKIVRVY